jgi:SAM-dependent methyltransferase
MAMDEMQRRRATSFGTIAEDYDRFRPEPPVEALDWVLPATTTAVAEIGAGTGALTRKLVARVAEVHAIEPDPRMRAVLERRAPGAQILDGRGEAIPLPEQSVDAVLAASSWHWVDQAKGFAEVARVLRPGGVVGHLWTGADRTVPWVARLMAGGVEVASDQRQTEAAARQRRHRPEMPDDAPFGEPESNVFRFSIEVTTEALIGLPTTYSLSIILDPVQREEFVRRVERFVSEEIEPHNGLVELPLVCSAWRVVRL